MRKIGLVLLIAGAAIVFLLRRPVNAPAESPKVLANTPTDSHTSTIDADKKSASSPDRTMVFSNDGVAGRILKSAEGVAGTGNAKVATLINGEARTVCILTAGMARNYSLDEGLQPEQFPFIAAQNFAAPDTHVLQTMSIFRSLAKSEMKYSNERGDRIIILMCPKELWPTLDLKWPEAVREVH